MTVKDYDFSRNLSETKLLDELDFNSSFKVSIECPAGGGKSFYLLDYLKRKNIPFLFTTENLCKLMDNYLKNKEREEIHICL